MRGEAEEDRADARGGEEKRNGGGGERGEGQR